MATTTMRDSQFELMRIVSMLCIVYYHLFLKTTEHLWGVYPIFRGIQIPLHFGVLLFVMVSGYYGIRPSVRGGGKLFLMVAVYFLPLVLYRDFTNGDYLSVAKDFLLVSYPHYWFFRDYLFLFLFAPVINCYLSNINTRQRIYLISVLAFMAIWVGSTHGCSFLIGGKNLTNFLLLYTIGDTLRVTRDRWTSISYVKLIASFLIINTIIVSIWICTNNSIISAIIWNLSFPYCSPLLYLNAIIVFIYFGKMQFRSKVVNGLATSVFAIYLLHFNPIIFDKCIKPCAEYVLSICDNNPFGVIPLFLVLTLIIYLACTFIDMILHPLWKFASTQFAKIDERMSK